MKQDVHPAEDHEMEDELITTDNMTTDIVEDFARQLDQVVRLQDAQSDEEDEDDHFGYQQLPQDDDEDQDMYQQLASDDEEEVEVETQDPLEIKLEATDKLNSETSDLIKSIMTNIQLSNDAIPEWAKKIPESAWLPRVSK